MATNRSSVVPVRREDEEMYYSDIEGTRTQFTKAQLEKIAQKYDIPISTKISYAILEQVLSFLSGSKPYPKLMAPTSHPEHKQFTQLYEQAHNACWYESKANDELTHALRDAIVTGSGYLHTRKNNFFGETTFNVVTEHVPWTDVLVDPSSRKVDFSDAEMICICKVMPKTKAEKEFDVTLTEQDTIAGTVGSMASGMSDAVDDPYLYPASSSFGGYGNFKNDDYVWMRIFYEKKNVNLYVSESNDLASKRPVPVQIPNPEKQELEQALIQSQQQLEQAAAAAQTALDVSAQAKEEVQTSPDPNAAIAQNDAITAGNQQVAAEAQQMVMQVQAMKEAYVQMPDEVTAYNMVTLSGEEKVVRQVERIKRKQIVAVLMVGNQILEDDILPCQEFPIVHLCLSHNKSPNKTYGLMHYIKDVVKAMNKYWASMIYDMQINSNRKILAPTGAIENITQWENTWAEPGAVNTWEPNEALKDGGKPEVMEASPMNQGMVQIITMLTSLAEYITGIFGVMQGNNDGAPTTASGTSSLQNFGSQRVKLYGRYIENALQQLALVTIEYLQAFAPKDKILQYFDDANNPQEITMLDGGQDIKFKVRVNIANNLPTARQMAAQLLATISGQTANPQVADLLIQNALEIMDIPEADKIRKDMDVLKNMQAQLEQVQQQLDEQTSRNKALENQNIQQSMSNNIDLAKKDIDHSKEMAVSQIEQQAEQADGGEPPIF